MRTEQITCDNCGEKLHPETHRILTISYTVMFNYDSETGENSGEDDGIIDICQHCAEKVGVVRTNTNLTPDTDNIRYLTPHFKEEIIKRMFNKDEVVE